MRSCKLTVVHFNAKLGRDVRSELVISESSSGDMQIVRDGRPLVDADRSCVVTVGDYNVSLEVEKI